MRASLENRGMGVEQEISLLLGGGGASQAVSISSTSAQSAAMSGDNAVLYSTVDTFVRAGTNPTALSDGTDQFIPAGVLVRVRFDAGSKLAFKTSSASGTVYITPGA